VPLETITQYVKESYSLAGVLRLLDLQPEGGNYRTLKRFIKSNNIDISHFKGMGWNSGDTKKTCNPAKPLSELLNKDTPYASDRLKKRLIAEGLKTHRCESCNMTEWLGNPIPIELDHIDGDHDNNELSNLRILCPNCHALTSTYRGRHKRKPVEVRIKERKERSRMHSNCVVCNVPITSKAKHCPACYFISNQKIVWPTKDELLQMLSVSNYTQVAKQLGVSDNAIRKHLRNV
jgi:hypothetical protein